MVLLARIEPLWTEFAIPLLGIGLFAAVATAGTRRPARVMSLVVLTVLLGLWLFGEGLIWSKRWPSMIRGGPSWSSDSNAWQWSGLLALAYAAVVAVALSLRSFARARAQLGWWCAAVALAMFAAWTAVVEYWAPLGVIMAGVALAAVAFDAAGRRPTGADIASEPPPRNAWARASAIVATTVLDAFWLIISLIWFVFREGENVQCNCWADQRDAWQYSAQLLVALVGSAGLGIAVRSGLKRNSIWLSAGSIAAVAAIVTWVGLYISSRPPSSAAARAGAVHDLRVTAADHNPAPRNVVTLATLAGPVLRRQLRGPR
jgi:hypothetical protein